MEITTSNTKKTEDLAKQIAGQTKSGDIICLYGDLGSGKTTFTRNLVSYLGINSRVQSPTFVLHRIYQKDDLRVHHFDLYRITDIKELYDISFEDALNDLDSICVIEWPQIALEVLKNYDSRIKNIEITYLEGDQRKFVID